MKITIKATTNEIAALTAMLKGRQPMNPNKAKQSILDGIYEAVDEYYKAERERLTPPETATHDTSEET